MAVVASKSGLLIAAKLLRETPKAFIVEYVDDKGKERRISKADKKRKVFESVYDALDWIDLVE